MRGRCWQAATVVVFLAGPLAGCGMKGGSGNRTEDAERASGLASFRLADADLVVRATPASIVGSQAFKGFADEIRKLPGVGEQMEKSPEAMLEDMMGVAPAKVERVLVSMRTESNEPVVAVRASDALDTKAVLAALSEAYGAEIEDSGSHKGVALSAPQEAEAAGGAFAFPDERLLVSGPEADVKRGIDNLKAGKAVPFTGKIKALLDSAPASADLVVAAIPTPDFVKAAAGAVPMAAAAAGSLEEIDGVLVTVDAGEALDVTVRVAEKTEKDAVDSRKEGRDSVAQAKESLAAASAKPELAGLKGLLDAAGDVLDTVKVGGTGKNVDVSFTLRQDLVKPVGGLMQNPMALMMLMGALSGGAGAAPGMPGGGMMMPPPGP